MPAVTGYDYVIVGAGSAGCALARRLSDNPAASVAVIEAGGQDSRPEIHVPSEYFKLWGSEVDWNRVSLPQSGTANRTHNLPRGRVLGGSSAINGMVYLRGSREDFDGWAAEGCAGWDWESVHAAYVSMEAILRPTKLEETHELSEVFLNAAQQVGLPFNPFFDDGSLHGCGWNRSTILNGKRRSSYQAFLRPVITRPNLTVITNTEVDRLQVSPSGEVTGLWARTANGREVVIKSDTVILCAGAYESPRLLMASGIGPASHLKEQGIRPIIDLPVGEQLQDHLLIGVVYGSKREISTLNENVTESCAFTRSSLNAVGDCDIEISFAKSPHFAPEGQVKGPAYTIIPGITHLKSRGTVRLRLKSRQLATEIDHGYFTHADDMKVMIEAVRQSREIGSASAFGAWSLGEVFPGERADSDEAIADYVAKHVSTWFHPSGTCKMGIGESAVVSPDLRVRGTQGLRVADASIMPTVVSVNTNATSMMIGWHAADLIGEIVVE